MSKARFCSMCAAPMIEREIDHYSVCTGFASHRRAVSEWRDEVLYGRWPARAERVRSLLR
jgi:hypothetical protein